MEVKVNTDGFAAEINRQLTLYGTEVTKRVKKACKTVADETKAEIVSNSPKHTGDYKKGWQRTTAFEDANGVRYLIKNKTDWRLTHLLEYGHAMVVKKGTAKVTVGRIEGKPHIRPAELKAKTELTQRIKEAVKE
jgi:hypothetical protein